MSRAPFVIRAAGPTDFAAFQDIRARAGPGFTSLAVGDAALEAKLQLSAASFAASSHVPGGERYLLALEHRQAGAVVGCAGVKACVGDVPPFFSFRRLRVAQASAAAQRRFDLDVLILVNEFSACAEVGALFVGEEHRAAGMGRALAQSRYLLMAAAPSRFSERVVSELRGVVGPDGVSPFWTHLGAHFFKMSFEEADRLSATTDNQFILDLMPKYPIYADLLPEAARAVIGQCHPEGRGARRMLEAEGFRFDNVVDIFDAGPLLSVSRDAIRTIRETRLLKARGAPVGAQGRRALIASPDFARFRCAPTLAAAEGGEVLVEPEVLEALGLEEGAPVLAWISQEERPPR